MEPLSKLLKQKNLLAHKIKSSSHICWIADSVLAAVFENEALKSISFKNKTLKISVPSPVLAQKISFKRQTIVSKINEKTKDLNVKIEKIQTVIQ